MGREENNEANGKNYTGYDDRFSTYMWNKETGEVFGRTGKRWAQLTIFYIIFYIGLAAFASFCYFLFSKTLVDERPKWILEDSLIGTNPGMGYRPAPNPDQPDSTLIWYERGRKSKSSDAKFWYSQLTEYIDIVKEKSSQSDVMDCLDSSKKATKDKCCRIDVNNFGDSCSPGNKFGYELGDPCILLKLNKILGWEPDCFGISDGKYDMQLLREELAEQVKDFGMPASLKDYILKTVQSKPEYEKTNFLSTIWVSCEGEGKADQEAVGNFAYHSLDKNLQGISSKYFPYYKQDGYQSPFMFVQLKSPQPGVLLNIECKSWARNIIHDRLNRLGSVHFEVLIDVI